MPHNRIICKLHNYGISSNLLPWIRNFLLCRRQQVQVNSTLSNWENVTTGVVLLVLLLLLFADDTKLMQKLISTTSYNELQDDIN